MIREEAKQAEFLTTAQAAMVLNVSERTIRKMLRDGRLVSSLDPPRIPREQLTVAVDRNVEETSRPPKYEFL